ncbi:AAA family ATPase, partial [Pseudomonas aeruginosa]|nr:AAA family ATPase [Pseudomonas aeruginosa]
GFTEREVKEILAYYDLADKYEEVRQWYDGYQFSSQEIYNPWSIINYADTALLDRDAFPKPYWSNTSSNSIIPELV